MTTRTITKEQFSDETTIDGNRIEKALGDVQERFNNLRQKDFDGWVENRFNSKFCPPIRSTTVQSHYVGPFIYVPYSEMPIDLDEVPPNNRFRYKGAMRLDATTGQPIQDNPGAGAGYGLCWLWTDTHYFKNGGVINDLTLFGMFDDFQTSAPFTEKWFANDFEEGGEYNDDFHIWIVVDNPINLGDTFQRNSEVHMWGCSAQSLLLGDINYPPTTFISNENITYNPALAGVPATVRVNGLGARLTDLNIPVFAGARVRFVIGLPGVISAEEEIPSDQEAGGGGSPWNQDPSGVFADSRATWSNNLWHLNWSAFEPLEKP